MGVGVGFEVPEDIRRAALAADVEAFRRSRDGRDLVLETRGTMSVVYAPFDHINEGASIIIVGLTPGRLQAANALGELQRSTKDGASWAHALSAAKVHASFSGPMRSNLVAMLDVVGVADLLDIPSCADLFGARADLAHFTSALRYPVFVAGANYGGTPAIVRTPWLLDMAMRWLGEETRALSSAFIVPLGPRVREVVAHLALAGMVDENRVLGGLPHPSGANAERIAYFLGRKAIGTLSSRTDAARIDEVRRALTEKVRHLRTRTMPDALSLAGAS